MMMSTEIETKMTDHSMVTFWGGSERGICAQITDQRPDSENHGYIQLTMTEAAALAEALGAFVRTEALRRQGLLKDEIERLKNIEKTVFNEVAELPQEFFGFGLMSVKMIDKFCPIVKYGE